MSSFPSASLPTHKHHRFKEKPDLPERSPNKKTWICPILQTQYGANCMQPMTEIFFVGSRRFFAALLGGTQEKATTKLRKIACQRFMFSYEDGAKAPSPFVLLKTCHCEAGAHTGCGNPFPLFVLRILTLTAFAQNDRLTVIFA